MKQTVAIEVVERAEWCEKVGLPELALALRRSIDPSRSEEARRGYAEIVVRMEKAMRREDARDSVRKRYKSPPYLNQKCAKEWRKRRSQLVKASEQRRREEGLLERLNKRPIRGLANAFRLDDETL